MAAVLPDPSVMPGSAPRRRSPLTTFSLPGLGIYDSAAQHRVTGTHALHVQATAHFIGTTNIPREDLGLGDARVLNIPRRLVITSSC